MDSPKKPPGSPAPSWHDDGLEFELTDFDSARRVLDGESISQFDVASFGSPDRWKKLRRDSLPTDRALDGRALDWLMSLPPHLRPERLITQFPRVANALAQVWDEPQACQAALDKLLASPRKNRQGFPPEVQYELMALANWTQVF